LRALGRAGVVEGGVAVVVLEFLEPPSVLADGVVPLADRGLAGQVAQVVPAAGRVLDGDQGLGGLAGGCTQIMVE
jgi:hypothetical protein